ncbi:MAG TPA: formylglycine-generating enzyme family protein, partial [Pirellulales bacterium]|nr:formylglycine-generating enzyme family protein [Pirellulales bacterium]
KEQRFSYYARDGEAVKILGGAGYRLPTEAETEYACRAGTTRLWAFGDNERDLGQHAWFRPNSNGRTQPVGKLHPNPFGLYDLYGNVWEWCWDWHGEYAAGAIGDPTGSDAGSGRVLRGGAFYGDAFFCRSALRGDIHAVVRNNGYGFRVARTIDPTSEVSPPTATGGSAAGANDMDPDAASVDSPPLATALFDAIKAVAHQEAWAKHLGAEVDVENSLAMKLRLIPPGEFMMGSPQDEIDALVQSSGPSWHDWFRSEGPRHHVKLTQAFYLGSCEVTQQQYKDLMGVNPSHYLNDVEASQLPVEMVSWFEAVEFCNKLSERERRSPYYLRDGEAVTILGGTGYRLPLEAEWEYACRAGTTTRWSFGDNDTKFGPHAWFLSNAGQSPHRVGELLANPYGLYDMHGNIWEWCWDLHGAYDAATGNDPTGSLAGIDRVVRGGAFPDNPPSLRSAYRTYRNPAPQFHYIGFRVARTIDTKSEVSPATAAGDSAADAHDTDQGAASVNPPPLAIAPFDAKQAVAYQKDCAKHLGAKVEMKNSLGMKMRLIPPGKFMMGSTPDEIDALVSTITHWYWQPRLRSEGPRHSVRLTRAFYLGSCEVTQRQFQELMGVNPSQFSLTGARNNAVQGQDTSQHPVDSATWYDAVDFCNKLSQRERRSAYYAHEGELVKILGGSGYRLPTEAEWENACRAGTTTQWSLGENEQNVPQDAWVAVNSGGRTHGVGQLRANPFGLHDLHGNLWEWCWDWHGDYATEAVSDPTGPSAGSERVLRGGSYLYSPLYARSAVHTYANPWAPGNNTFGFRVARTIDTKSEVSPKATTDPTASTSDDAQAEQIGVTQSDSPETTTPSDSSRAMAKLDAAKVAHDEKIEKFKSDMLDSIKKKEDAARAQGEIGLVQSVIVQREALEKYGIPPDFAPKVEKYAAAMAKANAPMEAAYAAAVRALAKAKEDELAEEVRRQRKAFQEQEGAAMGIMPGAVWEGVTTSTRDQVVNGGRIKAGYQQSSRLSISSVNGREFRGTVSWSDKPGREPVDSSKPIIGTFRNGEIKWEGDGVKTAPHTATIKGRTMEDTCEINVSKLSLKTLK